MACPTCSPSTFTRWPGTAWRREGSSANGSSWGKWEAATWILAAIGDAQFRKRHFDGAAETLQDAMRSAKAIGNPFLHLRLGESLFEIGQRQRAMDELARAYMGAGREIFDNEDPKYFEALKTVLKPPPGQTSL